MSGGDSEIDEGMTLDEDFIDVIVLFLWKKCFQSFSKFHIREQNNFYIFICTSPYFIAPLTPLGEGMELNIYANDTLCAVCVCLWEWLSLFENKIMQKVNICVHTFEWRL